MREVVQNAESLPHKNAMHGVTKLVTFSSIFDSAGELTFLFGNYRQPRRIVTVAIVRHRNTLTYLLTYLERSPVPLAMRRRGEGARLSPTIQTPTFSGFLALSLIHI